MSPKRLEPDPAFPLPDDPPDSGMRDAVLSFADVAILRALAAGGDIGMLPGGPPKRLIVRDAWRRPLLAPERHHASLLLRAGYIVPDPERGYALTPRGAERAWRPTEDHAPLPAGDPATPDAEMKALSAEQEYIDLIRATSHAPSALTDASGTASRILAHANGALLTLALERQAQAAYHRAALSGDAEATAAADQEHRAAHARLLAYDPDPTKGY